jgi:hypothetical protein
MPTSVIEARRKEDEGKKNIYFSIVIYRACFY